MWLHVYYPCLSPSQYARDFYIGQWLRDSQLELEKALQGPSDASTDLLALEDGDDPEISSSAVALQQAEVKKEMLHSLMDAKTLTKLKLAPVACLFGESVSKWYMYFVNINCILRQWTCFYCTRTTCISAQLSHLLCTMPIFPRAQVSRVYSGWAQCCHSDTIPGLLQSPQQELRQVSSTGMDLHVFRP